MARRIGQVLCGILTASSGATGLANGIVSWQDVGSPGGRWLAALLVTYGVAGVFATWALWLAPRRLLPLLGAWAVGIVGASTYASFAYAEPAARLLVTGYTAIASTLFVLAVVGYARRILMPPSRPPAPDA